MEPQLEEAQKRELELKIRTVLRNILDQAAFERLSLVRLSNQEVYSQVVSYLFSLYQSGKIRGRISEEELKRIASLFIQRKEGKITRFYK